MATFSTRKKRKAGQESPIARAWRVSYGGLVALFVFGAFVNILKFAMPLYLLQVVDRVPASRSVETLVLLTILAIVAVAVGFALDIVRRRLLTGWGIWAERSFGPEIVRRGFASGFGKRAVDVDRALSDLTKLRVFTSRQMVNWIDLIWAPVFLLGTYLIHPWMGMLAIAGIVVLIVLGQIQDRLSAEPRRASSNAYRENDEILSTAARHRESVGALGMATSLTERWERTATGRLTERERIDAQWHFFRTVMRGLSYLMRIGLIGLGMYLVLQNELTIGGIFAARVMAGFGFVLIENAVKNQRGLREVQTSYGNLKELLEAQPPTSPEMLPGTETASLRLDLITHRHSGQRADLYRRLSLEVAPGQLLLVSGQGGTGKTTLTHLITGLSEPRFGKIFLGDTEISDLPVPVRTSLIGYLPQHTELFSGTVRENIARMENGAISDVIKAAKLAGIHDYVLSLPRGYETPLIAETFDALSGSERKRIALARAFYGAPRILVLDEPAANLDSPSRRVMETALRTLKAQGTIIVVTQSVASNQLSRMADLYLDFEGGTYVVSTEADSRPSTSATDLRRIK